VGLPLLHSSNSLPRPAAPAMALTTSTAPTFAPAPLTFLGGLIQKEGRVQLSLTQKIFDVHIMSSGRKTKKTNLSTAKSKKSPRRRSSGGRIGPFSDTFCPSNEFR
jgi:hypothetical protein